MVQGILVQGIGIGTLHTPYGMHFYRQKEYIRLIENKLISTKTHSIKSTWCSAEEVLFTMSREVIKRFQVFFSMWLVLDVSHHTIRSFSQSYAIYSSKMGTSIKLLDWTHRNFDVKDIISVSDIYFFYF